MRKIKVTTNDILFGILLIAYMIGPYFRGLFFRQDIYYFQLIVALIMLVILAVFWWQKILDTNNTTMNNTNTSDIESIHNNGVIRLTNRPIDLITWGIATAYVIALFGAVDIGLARDELLKNISYALVYTILIMTIRTRIHQSLAFHTYIITALWISIFGYGVAMGTWEFTDGVFGLNRLSSVFQYPNTFAAFVGGAFFASIIMALNVKLKYEQTSQSDKADNVVRSLKKTVVNAASTSIYTVFAMVFFLTILLSGSRAAFAVFALVFIIGLIITRFRDKLSYIIFSGIAMLPALYLMPKVNTFMIAKYYHTIKPAENPLPDMVWNDLLIVIIATFLIALIYGIIHQFNKLSRKTFAINQVAVLLVIVIIIISASATFINFYEQQDSLQNLTNRLKTILAAEEQSSFNERNTFISDAIKIYKDYPINGAGGGAWLILFQKYQDYSYWSTQAHIYYLQLATDTGTIGIIALITLLLAITISLIYLYYQNHKHNEHGNNYILVASYMAILMMLGHSAADFNMSFMTFAITIWLLFAVIISGYGFTNKELITDNRLAVKLSNIVTKLFNIVIPTNIKATIMTIATIAVLLANISPISANKEFAKANEMLEQEDIAQTLLHLQNAHKADKLESDYITEYVAFLLQVARADEDEANRQNLYKVAHQTITKAASKRPENISVQNGLVDFYLNTGNYDKALEELDNVIAMAPYRINYYNDKINLLYQMAENYLVTGELALAKAEFDKLIDVYNNYADIQQDLKEREVYNTNVLFNMSHRPLLHVGKAMYLLGEYEQAAGLLSIAKNNKDTQNESLMWLAAAYHHIGSIEEYNKVLEQSKGINEANVERIQDLIALDILE